MQDKNDRPEPTPAEQEEKLKKWAFMALLGACLSSPLILGIHKAVLDSQVAAVKNNNADITALVPEPPDPVPTPSTYEPTPVASSLPDRSTVGAIILSVACGSQTGLVSRSETGSQIKSLLESEGINPQVVYDNWDYYYSRAKEMNDFKGYSCVQ